MRVVVDNGPGNRRRASSPGVPSAAPALGWKSGANARRLRSAAPAITLRAAVAADAPELHALVASHLEEGRLLPRALDELAVHAPRFVVAVLPSASGDRIVGCAELAPLSAWVAEVRSLVVGREARGMGLGLRMLDELGRRARREGFSRLCAFAHDPAFFVRLGFSIVPHTWVPEKIAHDCHQCPLFRNCGQYAVVLDLQHARSSVGTLVGISGRASGGAPALKPRG